MHNGNIHPYKWYENYFQTGRVIGVFHLGTSLVFGVSNAQEFVFPHLNELS